MSIENFQEEEKSLIRRCQDGDKEAFHQLIEAKREEAFLYAIKITHNREDAEDIVQEAFIQIYKSINQFQYKCKFSTWLYRIIVNTAINFLNKKNSQKTQNIENFENFISSQHSQEYIVEVEELCQQIQSKINSHKSFSKREGLIYSLHFEMGLSASKISKILEGNSTEKSVSVSYTKIIKKIRSLFEI